MSHVGEHLAGLFSDPAVHDLAVLHRETAAHVEKAVGPDGLAIGADRRRSLRTGDHLARHGSANAQLAQQLTTEDRRKQAIADRGAQADSR